MKKGKFNYDGVVGAHIALKKRLKDQGFEISGTPEETVKSYLKQMFNQDKYNGHVNYIIDSKHEHVFLQGVPRSGSPKECSFQLRKI